MRVETMNTSEYKGRHGTWTIAVFKNNDCDKFVAYANDDGLQFVDNSKQIEANVAYKRRAEGDTEAQAIENIKLAVDKYENYIAEEQRVRMAPAVQAEAIDRIATVLEQAMELAKLESSKLS